MFRALKSAAPIVPDLCLRYSDGPCAPRAGLKRRAVSPMVSPRRCAHESCERARWVSLGARSRPGCHVHKTRTGSLVRYWLPAGLFRWARALSMAPRRPRHSPRRIAPDLPWSASEHSPRTGPRARIAPPLARGDATRGGPPSLIRRGPRGACCRSDGSRRRRRRRREGCAARRPRRAAGVWWSRSDSVWAAAAPPPPPPSSSPEGERAGGRGLSSGD